MIFNLIHLDYPSFVLVKLKSLLTLIIVLVSSVSALQGQNYAYTQFTVDDGLPSNYVYGAIEDDEGYMWAFTENGIAKYDGVKWKVYNKKNGLPSNDTFQMIKDESGRLWIVNVAQKACYVYEDSIHVLNNFNGSFRSLSGLKGRIEYDNLYSFDSTTNDLVKIKQDRRLADSLSAADNTVVTFVSGEKFNFATTEEKLVCQNQLGQNLELLFPAELTADQRVKGYYSQVWNSKSGEHFVLQSVKNTLVLFEGETDFRIYDWEKLTGHKCYKPVADRVGDKLFLSSGRALIVINDSGEVEEVLIPEGKISKDYIHRFFMDSNGNYWLGTKSNGLILYKQSTLKTTKLEGLEGTELSDAIFRLGNHICVITDEMELYTIESGKLVLKKELQSGSKHNQTMLTDDYFISMSTMNALQLDSTLTLKEPSRLQQGINYESESITSYHTLIHNIKSYLEDYHGDRSYFYSRFGFVCLDHKKKTAACLYRGKEFQVIFQNDQNHEVYAVSDQTLFKVNEDRLDSIFTFNDRVKTVKQYNQNQLFVGTENDGLQLYDFTRNTSELFFDVPFVKDIEIENDVLFAATSVGVLKLNLEDKNDHYIYDYKDGLAAKEINDIYLEDKLIYVASINGVYKIDRNKEAIIRNSSSPYFSSFSSNNISYDLTNEIYLPPNAENIYLSYNQLDYSSGDQLKFRYKLLPNSNSWVETSDRELVLSGLSPGDYELKLESEDVFGNVNSAKESLRFTLGKKWWQTNLFLISLIVLLAALFIKIITKYYDYKFNKYRKEELAKRKMNSLHLESLRSQMNPHFIFNSLGSIQYYIQTNKNDDADEYLGMFAQLMRKYLDSAVESFITVENEIALLDEYTKLEMMRFDNKFKIEIDYSAEGDLMEEFIPTMILQPFVENSINHGLLSRPDGKGELTISFNRADKGISCTIADNGVGIENGTKNKNPEHKSRGMLNVKDRIRLLSESGMAEVELLVTTQSDHVDFPGTIIELIFKSGVNE